MLSSLGCAAPVHGAAIRNGAESACTRWRPRMKIRSDSFQHGKPIPPEFAMGARDSTDGFGGNRNPHLAWDGAPAGTRGFALLCIDTDAPTDGALVANSDTPIPVPIPRDSALGGGRLPADCARSPPAAAATASPAAARHWRDAARALPRLTAWFAGECRHGRRTSATRPVPPPTTCAGIATSPPFALDVPTRLAARLHAGDVFRACTATGCRSQHLRRLQ